MKKIAVYTNILLLLIIGLACKTPHQDSLEYAKNKNAEMGAASKEVAAFLTEAIDARMMDIAQGRLAKERATTPELKTYGDLMIEDQTKLLNEIKTLAATKQVVLPSTLSKKKEKGLEDLKKEEGELFDEKFMKMMIIDHKRDVKEFEKAKSFDDKDVKTFAANYLPMIQGHLTKIEKIKKEY